MSVGVDLDNTIICYDALFQRVARERGLIPDGKASAKDEVKALMLSQHGNDLWTELQAEVYGAHVVEAEPYPHVREFFLACRRAAIRVYIISHKTQFPVRGPHIDLRRAAMTWLDRRGWFEPDGVGLRHSDVEFHDSRAAKIEAIRRRQCKVFVDDLADVFTETAFPGNVHRILFDPSGTQASRAGVDLARDWRQVEKRVFDLCKPERA